MTSSLFDTNSPHIEPSTLTAFAGNRLIRNSEHRHEGSVQEAMAQEGARIFVFTGDKLVLKHDGQVVDPLFLPYELADLEPQLDEMILLGHLPSGEPHLAVPVGISAEGLASHYKACETRELWREQLLDEALLGEAAQAASLIRWNADNHFCGRCGSATHTLLGGYKRVCDSCNHMMFPRTDPVVIMLTIDEKKDRCLLGRGPHFASGMYSCLAGFVEPGETMEDAVRRETREESGIKIGRVHYHASQPWPMPYSMMIGCYSEALSSDIIMDAAELDDCRWFTREEVRGLLDGTDAEGRSAPAIGAIAHRLMTDWVEWRR